MGLNELLRPPKRVAADADSFHRKHRGINVAKFFFFFLDILSNESEVCQNDSKVHRERYVHRGRKEGVTIVLCSTKYIISKLFHARCVECVCILLRACFCLIWESAVCVLRGVGGVDLSVICQGQKLIRIRVAPDTTHTHANEAERECLMMIGSRNAIPPSKHYLSPVSKNYYRQVAHASDGQTQHHHMLSTRYFTRNTGGGTIGKYETLSSYLDYGRSSTSELISHTTDCFL